MDIVDDYMISWLDCIRQQDEPNSEEEENEGIAACAYDACPLRLQCLRWQLGTNKDPYQTWFDGSECNEEYFIKK